MSLAKRTYVDNKTVITAENLNAIQDAIIENENDIADLKEDGSVTTEKLANKAVTKAKLADEVTEQIDGNTQGISDLNDALYENVSPTMIDGSYINANGNIGSNASFSLSDYIKVESVVAVYSAMASGYAIYYFDKDKQKISAQDVSNPSFEAHLVKLNVPSNAVYFRFNDYISTLAPSSCYLLKSIPNENTASLQVVENDLSATKNTALVNLNVIWENGYFINSSNGNTAANDRYKSSPYLDISQYKKLFVRSKVTASGLGFAFYDEAKNYISGQTTVSGEFWSVDIPYNAYYVRTCTLADSVGECFGFGERSDADANFINQYAFEFTDGHYINITNGNDSTIVGNSATDFIKLYPNCEKLTIWSATNNSLIGMAFYNANKEFVSGNLLYTVGGILESKTLNVPKSARYFRFSCLTSAKAYAKAYSPITTEMQMEKYTDLELLPFVSAKFVCVGDSLTAGDFYPKGTNISSGDTQKNYPYFLGRILNVPIINAGKSGATPLSWWSEVHPSVDFSDSDTMILWLGTNGGLTDTLETDVDPYSDYNDYANTNTGTYCKIIEDFLHETTDGKVFLVNTYNSDNVTDSVINKIGAKYGVPVFDIKYLMRTYSPEMFNTNVVHRNTYGNLKVAEYFREQKAEWWSDNIDKMDFCFHTKENPLT